MPNRIVLACLLLTAAGAAQSLPNTLVVIADDVGVDGIGCYGYATAGPTPNLDALATRGLRFTNAVANPVCSPTRAGLLTGRYGFRTGIGNVVTTTAGLAASETILPEILAPAGIATALIGKWHLGTANGPATPTVMGFGEFTGSLQGAIADYFAWPKVQNGVMRQETTYATTDLVDEAIAFVGRQTGPWYLQLAFHSGHTPLHAPPANLHTQNLAGLDPATTPVPFYHAMVEAMDTELGRLFAALPTATLANTNVVFLGDNGTANAVVQSPFDPQRSKGTVYQGGVRVPMLVAGPAVVGLPRVESAPIAAVDWFVTLAALQGVDAFAAVPPSTVLDGVDQRVLLAPTGAPPRRTYAFSEIFGAAGPMAATGDAEHVRDGQYELLRFVGPSGMVREELYDHAADPWETTDLLAATLSTTADRAYRALRRELNRLRGVAMATPFGVSCSGGGLSPQLRAITQPTLGGTLTMRITGLDASVSLALGVVGFDDLQWSNTPLPWALDGLGMPGCNLYVSPAITELLPRTTTVATWTETIPAATAFLGIGWFAQGLLLAPAANAAGALATRAVEVRIGA